LAASKQIALSFDFPEPEPEKQPVIIETEKTETTGTSEEIPAEPEANNFIPEPEPVIEMQVLEEEPVIAVTNITGKPLRRGRRSLKELELEAELVEVPEDEVLFSRQYYSMHEVTQMFHVTHSLLRYWESEFDILQPRKNRKGDRHFRPEDIKNLQVIHYLLRQKKYTIEGARDYMRNQKKTQQNFEAIQALEKIKSFLLEIRASL
jgi:DNA-binding transcriptional MerR regulator